MPKTRKAKAKKTEIFLKDKFNYLE